MSKCSGEHQHGGPREGHAHGHGTMWYVGDPAKAHHHHDLTCLREKDVALSALREECDRLRKQFRLDSAALKDEEITSLPALRARAEAAERKVEEAIERCNAAIEQGDCEASFDEFANIKQILEDK